MMATYGHLTSSPAHLHRHHHYQRSKKCCGFTGTFIFYVLFVFNFLLLISGLIILLVTFLHGSSIQFTGDYELARVRAILPSTHPLNLVHYAMIFCGLLVCITALSSLILYCCYGHKSKRESHNVHADGIMDCEDFNSTINQNGNRIFQRNSLPNRKTSTSAKPSIYLCSFIFALLLIFTIQLCIGLVAFGLSGGPYTDDIDTEKEAQEEFIAAIKEKENFNTSTSIYFILDQESQTFNFIQSKYKCCGIISYNDYPDTVPVADSCCKSPIQGCGDRRHPSNIYYRGCGKLVISVIKEHVNLLGSVSLGFSVLQIFGLIFSCCLFVTDMKR